MPSSRTGYIQTLFEKFDKLIAQGMGHISLSVSDYQSIKAHIANQAKELDQLRNQVVEQAAGIATASEWGGLRE